MNIKVHFGSQLDARVKEVQKYLAERVLTKIQQDQQYVVDKPKEVVNS